jgi:hypothetical protein
MAVKYEVWGRSAAGRRMRLRFNLQTAAEAKQARLELQRKGYADVVVVQRSPSYGRIKGLQKRGL